MGDGNLVSFGFKAEDVITTGRITRNEIDEFRDRIKEEKIPELTDEQIVLFLLSCDRDQKFTLTTAKEFYKAKQGTGMFNQRDLERAELQYQLNVIEYSIFPTRTDDGCAILFHRLQDTTSSHYHIEHSMKLLFMTLDAAVYDNPPPTGLIILFDMKGVGLMHLTRIKIGAIKTFCHYLQEGLPVKLKEIHVLNVAYFIDKVMLILKPFIKTELLERLHFHPPSTDMEQFNREYLPKRCLPSDFGGELPDVRSLHAVNTLKLETMRPFFDAEEEQRRRYYGNC